MEAEQKKIVFIVAADVLTKMVEGDPTAKDFLRKLDKNTAEAKSPISALLVALRDCKKADHECLNLIEKKIQFVLITAAHQKMGGGS